MSNVLFPIIIETVRGDQEVTIFFTVPPELMYFEGHFDNTPILPGVVQTHWAEHFGREFLQVEGIYKQLEAVKFQHVIQPDQTIELHLRYEKTANKLYYRYQSAAGPHSSGRIIYSQ